MNYSATMRPSRDLTLLRHLMLALALFTLAARAAVPAGFMPATRHGVTRLVPCDGMAPMPGMTMAMPGHTDAHHSTPHDGNRGSDHTCAFGAAGFVAALPFLAAPLPAPRPSRDQPPRPTGVIRPGHGLAAPPPWQTGPPAIA